MFAVENPTSDTESTIILMWWDLRCGSDWLSDGGSLFGLDWKTPFA